jgi:hypothetical protein
LEVLHSIAASLAARAATTVLRCGDSHGPLTASLSLNAWRSLTLAGMVGSFSVSSTANIGLTRSEILLRALLKAVAISSYLITCSREPHHYCDRLLILQHRLSLYPLVYNSTPHPQWSSGYDFRLSLTPTSRGRPGFDSLLRSIQNNDSSSIIMSSGVG